MADDFEVIHRFAGIGSDGGDGFGSIDGAAAAETDDEVGIASSFCAFTDERDGGFARDAEELAGDALQVVFGAILIDPGDD